MWAILEASPQVITIGDRRSKRERELEAAKGLSPSKGATFHFTYSLTEGPSRGEPDDSYIAYEKESLLSKLRSGDKKDAWHLELAAFGHELQHGWGNARGIDNRGISIGSTTMQEVRGVMMENLILDEYGRSVGTVYNGEEFPLTDEVVKAYRQIKSDVESAKVAGGK